MSNILSGARRKIAFVKYNLSPFRLSLAARHVIKRFGSMVGMTKGFRIIDLALTYDCNLFCVHCSADPLKQNRPSLTLGDYRRIVQEAHALDVLSWNITGGEPLLIDWLEDLIRVLEPPRHYISVQTNCVGLTEKRAETLARAGVNCITTSIDSIDADEHDRFRGLKDAYRDTLRGIGNARRAGLRVLVGGTVTHQNLRSRQLERLIEAVNREGAIFLFNLAVPCGSWKGRNDVVLRGDDRNYLRNLMTRYPLSSTDHEVGRNAIGCPAGVEKIYITPYGDVLPCPFIHVSFGNVREKSLHGIVARMQTIDWFNRYQDICIAAEDSRFHLTVLDRIHALPEPYPVPFDLIFETNASDQDAR